MSDSAAIELAEQPAIEISVGSAIIGAIVESNGATIDVAVAASDIYADHTTIGVAIVASIEIAVESAVGVAIEESVGIADECSIEPAICKSEQSTVCGTDDQSVEPAIDVSKQPAVSTSEHITELVSQLCAKQPTFEITVVATICITHKSAYIASIESTDECPNDVSNGSSHDGTIWSAFGCTK